MGDLAFSFMDPPHASECLALGPPEIAAARFQPKRFPAAEIGFPGNLDFVAKTIAIRTAHCAFRCGLEHFALPSHETAKKTNPVVIARGHTLEKGKRSRRCGQRDTQESGHEGAKKARVCRWLKVILPLRFPYGRRGNQAEELGSSQPGLI